MNATKTTTTEGDVLSFRQDVEQKLSPLLYPCGATPCPRPIQDSSGRVVAWIYRAGEVTFRSVKVK